jgi:DNA-binding LacI/PurR family transcriptional regulator
MTEKRTPPHVRARQLLIALIDRLTAQGIERLPGERQLSTDLGVSLNTVKKAIRQLASEDRLVTAPRDGHFICAKRKTIDVGLILGEGQTCTFVRDPGMLACILTTLHRHDCIPRILHIRESADAARIIEQYRLDGCIWYLPRPTQMRSIAEVSKTCHVPIVVTQLEHTPECPDMPPIFTYDFQAVGRERAEFLLARNHRRIAYCSSDRSQTFAGFAAALSDQGIPLDRTLIIPKPEDIPRRLPPLLREGSATAIISDGGLSRLEPLFSILEGHPWNERGDLLIDYIGAGHEKLCKRHPLVRIAAINYPQDQEIGRRATEALLAAIDQHTPVQGLRCSSRILPQQASHV